ncbi:MAG: CPBP family intramembrane metalloprotease [Clostridiales bacterium]|nr:CPBP family intramembrane metalloprotease [Clostridiales bacterium]
MSKIIDFIKNISPLNNRTKMPKILYIIKVILLFFFCKLSGELIGEGIIMLIHFACGKNPLKGEIFGPITITLMTYFGYSVMLVIIMLIWKLFQKKTLAELGVTKTFGHYLIGMTAGAVLVVISALAVVLTGSIDYVGLFPDADIPMVALFFFVFIFQGAFEEFLCRGVVLQLLRKNTSLPIAVAVSTALFVAPHIPKMFSDRSLIVVFALINTILVSLIFSFLTVRFNSIWAACGMHTVWNFIIYNVMGLNLSGNDGMTVAVFDMRSVGSNILNGAEYGIEASAVTTAVLILALAVCFYFSRKPVTGAIIPAK